MLRSLRFEGVPAQQAGFPWDVPAVRSLETLEFLSPVTFFVGENGSGKSTLLEAIAVLADLPTVGSQPVRDDPTLLPQRQLAQQLRAAWSRRARRGFFLRAEDFFGFARNIAQLKQTMLQRLEDVDRDFREAGDYARGLAAGPARASLADLQRRYGAGVDARSHGESFLSLFQSRLVPGGLFLLDEPEAALSPQSQLGLLTLIADAVKDGGQFIIATHSPLLLAFPDAVIWSFDSVPPAVVPYDELEHVTLTRAFLADPRAFTRHLVADDDR